MAKRTTTHLHTKDKEKILEMYHEFKCYHEIAKKTGFTYNAVFTFLKKQGLDRLIRTGKKMCNSCKFWLPLDEFNLNNKNKNKLNSYCRDCAKNKTDSYLNRKDVYKIIKEDCVVKYSYKSVDIFYNPAKKLYVLTQNTVIIDWDTTFDSFASKLVNTFLDSVIAQENKEIMLKHVIKIKKELLKMLRENLDTVE